MVEKDSPKYTLSLFLYEDARDPEALNEPPRPGKLLVYDQFTDRLPWPVFLREFTPRNFEDMNMPVILRCVDGTYYKPGMNRLCLKVYDTTPEGRRETLWTFDVNWQNESMDVSARTRSLDMNIYRSIIVEFDWDRMKDRGI
jgi:hypothetical protein